MDLHDFHLPAEEHSKSQQLRQAGTVVHHIAGDRENENAEHKPFTPNILCVKCDYLTMAH